MDLTPILNFLSTTGALVLGSAISSVILGFMADKFIIKKIFRNDKVKRLLGQIDRIQDKLDEITKKT
jgi:hypothetical protein